MKENNYKKFIYKNVDLYNSCIREDLHCKKVVASIKYFLKKNNCGIEKTVKKVIDRQITKKNNHIIKKLINNLRINETYTKSYIKLICTNLKVSIKNVTYITKRGYDPRSAIIIIYYASNKVNNTGKKSISKKLFDKIISSYEIYLNYPTRVNLKTLMLLFCSCIKISRNDIFTLLDDGFILKKARKFVRDNDIDYQSIGDIASEINIGVIEIINSLLPYEKEQIYKYINLKLKSLMHSLLIKYKNRDISLDSPRFTNSFRISKPLLDYIAV